MLGYDHDSFWKQTPRTLSLTWEAANELLKRDHNDRAWLAWHTAGLSRTKKFPPLSSLRIKDAPQKRSLQEQLDGLKEFVIATGGTVIYQPKEKLNG